MSSVVSDWDNEYARIARAASQVRTQGLSVNAQPLPAALQRLDTDLNALPLPPTEIQRRRRLVQHLMQQQQGGGGGYQPPHLTSSSTSPPQQQQQSLVQSAMQQQDNIIDELASGVGRLKNQTVAIHDEARQQVSLLNDVEGNLDQAHVGLEGETRRAMQLREEASLWKLQMIVAALFILLVLLIIMGVTP